MLRRGSSEVVCEADGVLRTENLGHVVEYQGESWRGSLAFRGGLRREASLRESYAQEKERATEHDAHGGGHAPSSPGKSLLYRSVLAQGGDHFCVFKGELSSVVVRDDPDRANGFAAHTKRDEQCFRDARLDLSEVGKAAVETRHQIGTASVSNSFHTD